MTHWVVRTVLVTVAVAAALALAAWQLLPSPAGGGATSTTTVATILGNGVRAKQIREQNDASYDDAYETCEAAGLGALAVRLHVSHPTPTTVARAFALGWDPAFRAGPYRGCLAGLLDR
jgi:hypothetical protein